MRHETNAAINLFPLLTLRFAKVIAVAILVQSNNILWLDKKFWSPLGTLDSAPTGGIPQARHLQPPTHLHIEPFKFTIGLSPILSGISRSQMPSVCQGGEEGCQSMHYTIKPTTKQLLCFFLKIWNFNSGCQDGIVRVNSGHWRSNLCSKSVQFRCLYSRIDSGNDFLGNFKLNNGKLRKQTIFFNYWQCGKKLNFSQSWWLCGIFMVNTN